MSRIAIFGATGAIGSAVHSHLTAQGHNVVGLTSGTSTSQHLSTLESSWLEKLNQCGKIDSVVWAQGFNQSDNIVSFDIEVFNSHLTANVTYILDTLNQLLSADSLSNQARLVILSSIWQDSARPNKLSYMVTKSALSGLVSSLCLDLGKQGICINAVLPGVADTPMTRQNLTAAQISNVISETPLERLVTLDELSKTVEWLCSQDSNGINGQFITIDNGWSRYRNV
jgi:hypothetical protein